MIKCDHWARVNLGLDEIPSIRIIFNVLKNINKNQINTKNKIKMQDVLKITKNNQSIKWIKILIFSWVIS